MRIVVGIFILFAVSLCSYAEGGKPNRLHVSMFPQEAYLDEAAAFGFRGTPGEQMEIYLNNRKLKTVTFEKDELELNLILTESGVLSFQTGQKVAKFQLVLPEDDVQLAERESFLYASDLPVILLVRHKHPPKHDRRWEVVKLLSAMVKDTRPVVKSATLLGPSKVSRSDITAINKAAKATDAWVALDSGKSVYELNNVILRPAPKSDVVLFAFTGRDLKRGMSVLRLRMRTEWVLQRLKGCKHIFVLEIPASDEFRRSFPTAHIHLSLAARANGATLLSTSSRKLSDRLVAAAAKTTGSVQFK